MENLFKKYFNLLIIILITFGLIENIDQIHGIFSFVTKITEPFIYAIFIAYIIYPIKEKIKSNIKNNILSIIISYIIVIIILSLFGYLIIPQIGSSISELSQKIPTAYDTIMNYLKDINFVLLEPIKDSFMELAKNITTKLVDLLPNLFNILSNIIKTSLNWLIGFIVSFYFLIEKENMLSNLKKFSLAYLKEEKTNELVEDGKNCVSILNKFIVGKAIDSSIMGVLCVITMFMLDLDYVAFISLIFGVTNMIPYVGPLLGEIIGTIILLVVNPQQAFIFLIAAIILQMLDGYVIGPKVLKGKLGIKPIWIIFSVAIGGSLGGFFGMFLGTPIIAMIIYFIDKDINKRLEKTNKEG